MPFIRALLVSLLFVSPAFAERTFSTFAGRPGDVNKETDGPPGVGTFDLPGGVVSIGGGRFLVTDHRSLRRVDADGSLSTVAGGGSQPINSPDGVGAAASLYPTQYAVYDAASNAVFLTQQDNCRILRVNLTTRQVITYAGTGGCWHDDGPDPNFRRPYGIVVGPDGTLYIAEADGYTIRKLTTDRAGTTLAGRPDIYGDEDGPLGVARFTYPRDLVMGDDGYLYVLDSGRIRKVSLNGDVTTIAGATNCSTRTDGTGTAACFHATYSIARDAQGNMYVSDQWRPQYQEEQTWIRRVTPAGEVTTIGMVQGRAEGKIAVVDGWVYMGRFLRGEVVRMNLATGAVETFAGQGIPQSAEVNGPRQLAEFRYPGGLAVDPTGNIFVTDGTIRKIDVFGQVTTFATLPGFANPSDVAVDDVGNLYVADSGTHTIVRITPAGVQSVFAGMAGQHGYAEGTGAAARFNSPTGLFVWGSTVYVADMSNKAIRQINSLGETSLIAGGPGSSAFQFPSDVVRDASGNLFVLDSYLVKKIDAARNVTIFAYGFFQGEKIAIDPAGNLWVTDQNAVHKITPAGVITVEAGGFASGLVNGSGAAVRFREPNGIVATPMGLLVADMSNRVIRLGEESIGTRATIDAATGPLGQQRQLGTTDAVATSWQWSLVRRPAGSTATLSSASVRQPTFVPDVADRFVFRLVASNSSGTTVSEVSLQSTASNAPTITAVSPAFGPTHRATRLHVRGTNFVPGTVVRVRTVLPTTFVSSTELIAEVPPQRFGWTWLEVSVEKPDTQQATFMRDFLYGPEGADGRADFDGDGREELFWRNTATGQNGIWDMDPADPTKIVRTSVLPTADPDWTPAAFADFNRDGTADILWRNYHTGETAMWLISDLGLMSGASINLGRDGRWHVAGAGDVNSDGFADIIVHRYASGVSTMADIIYMSGFTVIGTTSVPVSIGPNEQIVAVRDFSGDGRADLLVVDRSSDARIIAPIPAGWTNAALPRLSPSSLRVGAVGDFDGDGDQDIFWRNEENGQTAVWFLNGLTVVSGAWLPTVSDPNMRPAGAARLGSDPRALILWRNLTTGVNARWLLSGTAVTGAFLDPVHSPSWDLLAPR